MLTFMSTLTAHTAGDLGELIRRIRKERGLTQTELAERANIARGALQKLERGRGTITIETFLKLLHAMSLDLALSDRVQSRDVGQRSQHGR